MTRSALIEALASRFPALTQDDADVAVKTILGALTSTLVEGNRIEIRGFGSFELTYRRAKSGRNPKTGEVVHIPEKRRPHFKPGKAMRQRVTDSVVTRERQRNTA